MPRVPPVINATRLRSDIPVLISRSWSFVSIAQPAQPALICVLHKTQKISANIFEQR
jgi:hypothetical protein